MTRRLSASAIGWLLLPLAALRLTRLITTDKLPEMLVLSRWRTAANRAEAVEVNRRLRKDPKSVERYDPAMPVTVSARFMAGLDCPFCIGFWIGLALIVLVAVTPKTLRPVLNVVLGALGLNYLVGHVSKKID